MNSRVPHMSGTPEERAKFADASKAHRDVYAKGFSLIASILSPSHSKDCSTTCGRNSGLCWSSRGERALRLT